MHNIGLLLVRMGKFRDAVTNFQHVMQEQGDFQTGLIQIFLNQFLDFFKIETTQAYYFLHFCYLCIAGLHLVLCSVALNDAEGGKAAFHAMLDVEPPMHHQDITIDDVSYLRFRCAYVF